MRLHLLILLALTGASVGTAQLPTPREPFAYATAASGAPYLTAAPGGTYRARDAASLRVPRAALMRGLNVGFAATGIATMGIAWLVRRRSHWWMLILSFAAGAVGLTFFFAGLSAVGTAFLAIYFIAIRRWVDLAEGE